MRRPRGQALVPGQLTSPSGVAGLPGAPCDVPITVRLGRPRWPRLARFVSWPGTVATNRRGNLLKAD